jgi:hypothetical protein
MGVNTAFQSQHNSILDPCLVEMAEERKIAGEFLLQGEFTKSSEAYDKALKLDPQSAP